MCVEGVWEVWGGEVERELPHNYPPITITSSSSSAIPGHHMQLCIQLSNKNIPDFLKHLEDRRYEYCPVELATSTAR